MRPQIIEPAISGDTSTAWYAVYTKHQHEKVATAYLEKKGLEVFLPLYSVASRWKDRTKTILFPLFPCYSFVRTSLARKPEILRAPGLFWLVEAGGRACPIPDSEIEMLQRIMKSTANSEPHPFLKCGDFVRVCGGALAGLEGILVQVKNQHRVVVSVEVLKKSVAVEVELSMLDQVRGPRGSTPLVTGEDRRERLGSDRNVAFGSALVANGTRIG